MIGLVRVNDHGFKKKAKGNDKSVATRLRMNCLLLFNLIIFQSSVCVCVEGEGERGSEV